MTPARQRSIGVALAVAIITAWAALSVYGVFVHPLAGFGLAAAPLLVATICWLDVGLFIVAHDAMHGSLAPGNARINRAFGRVALWCYAGFNYDALLPKHFAHHRYAGTGEDPDFSTDHPTRLWPWFFSFLRQYFGIRQFLILFAITLVLLLLGARLGNLLLFWALPAMLSSLQLFYFGTYRPHRHEEEPFADRHATRSSGFGSLASLLSCYHFGYHHEHHLAPHVPWWRLPAERQARATAR